MDKLTCSELQQYARERRLMSIHLRIRIRIPRKLLYAVPKDGAEGLELSHLRTSPTSPPNQQSTTDMTRDEDIKAYGFTAIPRPMATLLAVRKDTQPPTSLTTSDIPLPSPPLVTAVLEYAKHELPIETFNHSMRVFYYGTPSLPTSRQSLSNCTQNSHPNVSVGRLGYESLERSTN